MVLFAVCLTVLFLPVTGIHFLKLYESALVRQTESELISQTAFIGAAYKNELVRELKRHGEDPAQYGRALLDWVEDNDYYHPIPQTLDLSRDRILPPRPAGKGTSLKPAPFSKLTGETVAPVLKEAQRITLSGMKVLDFNGVQVAGQKENGLSFLHLTEVKDALKGKPRTVMRKRPFKGDPPPLSSVSRRAGVNVFVAAPIVLDNRLVGIVLVNRTPTDLGKALYDKRTDIGWAIALVVLATLGIAWLTSYAITQPIHRLIGQARRIGEGDVEGSKPIPHPTTREIATLSENLADMAVTIEHRSEYIRQFATHVSHEFKTPLTGIRGGVELLQEHADTMEPAQREKFLRNISEDTERLDRLVTRLLELARADVQTAPAEPTDLLPVLEPLVRRFRDYGAQVWALNNSGHETLPVRISRESIETIFSNLLDNSVRHGAKNIAIQLDVLAPQSGPSDKGESVIIRVEDDGQGISPANREKLFTPFFTTNREKGGTGLGLSIVQSLLTAADGSIAVHPVESGAAFRIALPLASSPV